MTNADEQQIHTIIRQWEQAIQEGDIANILANHDGDILMFDVPEPLQSRGMKEYRETWNLFFEYGSAGSDVFVIEELQITAGSDVAFATGLLRIGGSTAPVCRLTLGLKKIDGKWLITHEHHSAPYKLDESSETDDFGTI